MKMNIKNILLIAVVALVTAGCGAKSNALIPYQFDAGDKIDFSISKQESVEVDDEVLTDLNGRIEIGLRQYNLLAGDASAGQRTAEIVITNYEVRDDVTRFMAGILAGCDNIIADVTVKDIGTDQTVGESEIVMKRCDAWGSTSTIHAQFSIGIVKYLSGQKERDIYY